MNYNVVALIFDKCDFKTQINLKKCCRDYYSLFKIREIPKDFFHSLTNEILKSFPDLKVLYASDNPKITDEGIKGMSLHTLYASYNRKITDEGIKGMPLHTLYAYLNSKITDEGIKGLSLHTLYAYLNPKITDEGTKHIPNVYR